MKRKISLFLIMVLIVTLFAGCGGGNASNEGAANNSEEMDIIYYAFNSEPILNWDPSVMFSNGIVVLNNVYETLLRFDANDKTFENILATDYSQSEDGLSWTFHLREGVTFHDGEPFNADAVKFSIERTKEIGQGASYIWDSVSEIEIVDDYTVVFHLSYQAPIDLIVSSPYAAFIMSPAIADKGDEWFGEGNEAGTGPYMLESNSMGDEVILTEYKDYWNGWEGEHFEKAIIKKNSGDIFKETNG